MRYRAQLPLFGTLLRITFTKSSVAPFAAQVGPKAYNSLSFISRVKAGYRDALVASYQKALTAYWPIEGPGYREAAQYISGEQVPANGDLLAMLLGRMPHPPLLQVAQAVMPCQVAFRISG